MLHAPDSGRAACCRDRMSCGHAAAAAAAAAATTACRHTHESLESHDLPREALWRACHPRAREHGAVRRRPASGKTSFGTLMQLVGTRSGRKVDRLSMNIWVASRQSLQDFWQQRTGSDMAEALHPHQGQQRLFIIDSSQWLYALGMQHPFWQALKAINAAGSGSRVQVLLLAAQCSGAPLQIQSPYSLSLLRLHAAELATFFAAYNSTCIGKGYPCITPLLQEAMQRICDGHVGVLRTLVRQFCACFQGLASITPEQEADFAARCLSHAAACGRAFPHLGTVTPAQAAAIRDVMLAGRDGLILRTAELRRIPRAFIASGVFAYESVGSVVAFPTPAMRSHALLYLLGYPTRCPLEDGTPLHASTFVRAVLHRMQHEHLAMALVDRPLSRLAYQLAVLG